LHLTKHPLASNTAIMSKSNETPNSDSYKDVEMTDRQQFQSSPTASSIARSPVATKPRRKRQPRRENPGVSVIKRTPLPASVSAKQILEKYIDRLFFNNLLKVALYYDSSQICEKLRYLADPQAGLRARMRRAIAHIGTEFGMSKGAFYIAFNRESNRNGIYRPCYQDPKDEIVLANNATKIAEAMTWVKRGGPRLVNTVTPSAHDVTQPKSPSVVAMEITDDASEKESEPTPQIYPCPHPYCSCTYNNDSSLYEHIRKIHHQNAEALVQRAKNRQVAGPDGWVDLP
jgi:hypothetical protein